MKKEWIKNWFSNMERMEPLVYQGVTYNTAENFYQAMKLPKDRIDLRLEIAVLPPHKAKTAIRDKKRFPWREDWNKEEALKVMEYVLRHKFKVGTEWADKLLATGTEEIIEWNNWNDDFWGKDIDNKLGSNHLGRILMKIREDLSNVNKD